ncbi:MAG TPA: DUF2075 domain-containing protein [Gemmatimonadales bacterium]
MSVAAFLGTSDDALLGRLTAASSFDVTTAQRDAWRESIELLRPALAGVNGYLYLEFEVPRLGSRVDAVLISGPAIFPIEFKVGESEYPRDAVNQAWDYALDLKNFHLASHAAPILPILVATNAPASHGPWAKAFSDGVRPPYCCNGSGLASAIRSGLALVDGDPLDGEGWERSTYHPTPTIIEAARVLYSQHSVEAISRSDAGARNLQVTSRRVEEVIEESRMRGDKSIVFVTGVPGAGKTLVGLNVATQQRDEESPTHAVFLSGNGPLVAVLREALIRSDVARAKAAGEKLLKNKAGQSVKQFIQNIHHFRDAGVKDTTNPPVDHVVIFDEAQRAWNRAKTSDFMRRKKGLKEFDQSEAQFLIGYMDRRADWAVIVCLVGGGQEINDGEAGIATWLDAVREHFPKWRVYVSPRLTDTEYAALESVQQLSPTSVVPDEAFHLAVSMRSFRSERVSEFVKCVLDLEEDRARGVLAEVVKRYPIAVTRDLDVAKEWIRDHARGSERYGLVASSSAMRLKPHAIDVRVKTDPVHYFLNNRDDPRSSWYMEDPATEFQIQGLELDWVCMTWDADLRRTANGWGYFQFRGEKWQRTLQPERQRYLLNAYRVLLTRARQGMVIFVPPGDQRDASRKVEFYEGTYRYLVEAGVGVVG